MARPRRIEQEQTERKSRRDASLDRAAHMKMALPEECRADKDHYYYWSDEAKVYDRTKRDDYDVVTLEDPTSGDVRRVVGTKDDGTPQVQILLRKPMDFHRLHQKQKMESLKVTERALTDTVPVDPKDSNPSAAQHMYVAPGTSFKPGTYSP